MQQDLFHVPGQIAAKEEPQTWAFLERYRLTLRLDQALVAMIVLIMAYVLIFSFGVENGKRFAFEEIKAERAKRDQMVSELREKLEGKPIAEPAEETTEPHVSAPVEAVEETEISQEPSTTEKAEAAKPAGKFTIQLVTYTMKSQAELTVKTLAEKGVEAFVVPSGKYWMVCVNRFESQKLAQDFLTQLKSQGIAPADAFVRSMPSQAL
jgi:cell division septation protein DedD